MKKGKAYQNLFILIALLLSVTPAQAQISWFADGYHGGVYGSYPMWQAKFMVDKLTEIPGWAINLEIEPETWDTVSVKDAENFKALQEYYKNTGRFGRIEFANPAYAQPYCYNISGESIIRQFAYGMEKIREYFPDASFTTYSVQEPCFTSSLPQILKGFGYEYAVMRNYTCWGGYNSAFGKDLVNWIGPDGAEILSAPRYACDGLSKTNTWITASHSNSNEFIAAAFADGVKYPVGMTYQDAGWKGGPWESQYKPTVYTTWTNYMEMVKDKVQAEDWKFSLEDVKPGLVWGAQVLQTIAQEVRVSENQLVMAEKMVSFDYLLNGTQWPAADFAEGWRTLMLAQHHDCWIVPYNGRPGDTWADKVTSWTNSSNKIAGEKIDRLFKIETGSKNIKVFNTSGSTRTDRVDISIPNKLKESSWDVYQKDGKALPTQISADANGGATLYFEATVPAMGYATFQLKEAKNKAAKSAVETLANGTVKIETAYYSATVDPAKGGTITNLVDKKNGNRQLVKEGMSLNDLRGYFYEEGKFHNGSDSKAKVSVIEDGSLFVKIKVENEIAGNKYQQLISFAKNNPKIDFDLNIDWNGQPGIGAYDNSENYDNKSRVKAFYNDNYKLHLQFPLKDVGQKLYKNAPFDVCESQLENTLYSSWDSIKHNVIVNWVDVANTANNYGVSLFTDHTTSYLQTRELPLGLTVQYVGKALWGRTYHIHKPTHMKYVLLPHSGNWEQAEIEAASSDWNEPLIARFVNGKDKKEELSLLEVADKNLQLSSVRVDGKDLLVRFYNTSSINKKQYVRWNCKAEKMEQVDLNGKMLSAIQVEKEKDGRLLTKLFIPQFGFQTIKITKPKLK
jgi:alpha-mannosidase